MLGIRLRDDTPDDQAPGHAHLLVRRRHRYTGELSFCRCHSAAPVALAALVDTERSAATKPRHTAGLGPIPRGAQPGRVT
ncbi:hypothetical protein G5C60_49050, partial [Streptomyces sp. HC44]|nr:hypothetical protein [Streptomyces scabichelini]